MTPILTVTPKQKLRLESFETTDVLWTSQALRQPQVEELHELTGEDSGESEAVGKGAARREIRRPLGKAADKIRNKIRKLKGFWNYKPRMMPHIFKLVVREDREVFELHDLSLKGAHGCKWEMPEGKEGEGEEPEGEGEGCDTARESPLASRKQSGGLR